MIRVTGLDSITRRRNLLAMVTPKSVPVEAIIFDIGGVLIRIEIDAALKAVAAVSKRPAAGLAALYQHKILHDFEVGRVSAAEFHAAVERMIGNPFPYEHFCQTWNSIFQGEIEPTVALLQQLRRRPELKVGVLSNTNCIHLDWLREKMPALHGMEHLYASNEIGFRKPEPESYREVLKRMNVRAERTVFVDDLAENIDGARAVGMQVVHATTPEAVSAALGHLLET
jgi:HAD superfamily hydrolase (TIGR01509 family)